MANYKTDIVDIELNTGNIHRSFLNHAIGMTDANADQFGVRVFRGGEPVNLAGCSCQGFFRDGHGNNILINNGTVSGNEAYVVLPQACYNYEGQFTLAIKVIGGGVTGTMRIVDGVVSNTNTGGAVAPTGTVPTYQEILALYAEMLQATENVEAIGAVVERFRTTNLFDGDFDESGYIDSSTGADAASDDYKRTSKYYELDDLTATIMTVRVFPSTTTFNVLFYDSSKNYTGYDNCNNIEVRQFNIPSNSKYFRVYTDAAFASESYIGTVYVDEIVPYYAYTLKEDSVTLRSLAKEIKNKYNLMGEIVDNRYLQNTSGNVYDNVDDYRASDFIAVDPSTAYRLGIYNSKNGPSFEPYAITVCFYDSAYGFISYVYASTYTHTNCTFEAGMLKFTTPGGARFVRVGVNDSADPQKWMIEKASEPVLYVEPDSIKEEAVGINGELQGKIVAHFGDSIEGNTRDATSTPSFVSKASGATVYNFGFGGCKMAPHAPGWDNCSMYRLADDIYNQSFAGLASAIETGWSGMPSYFLTTVEYLKSFDFSKCDAIIISYGTNDYRDADHPLDNPNDKFDTSTVCGALRYSIRQIQSRYPGIQILVTCPIFRTFFVEGTTTVDSDSDTKNWGTGTLIDYRNAFEQACKDMHVQFFDLYYTTGFNPYTRLYYYPADDGTHPNEKGRERIGTLIGRKLTEMFRTN